MSPISLQDLNTKEKKNLFSNSYLLCTVLLHKGVQLLTDTFGCKTGLNVALVGRRSDHLCQCTVFSIIVFFAGLIAT